MSIETRSFNPNPGETTAQLATRIGAYLPANYDTYTRTLNPPNGTPVHDVLVCGWPEQGWTMNNYVLPRLASGLIFPVDTTYHELSRFINGFIDGYEDTESWAESEQDYWPDSLSAKYIDEYRSECVDFIFANLEDLLTLTATPSSLGGDFYLTRNRHGAGYWDRGYGTIGKRLTDASQVYGGTSPS